MTPRTEHTAETKTEDELWVTPEESMFRTRIPRPAHVGIHLGFAFCMFLVAVLIAIFMQRTH